MWCFHKYGNIDTLAGYQYCKKCNKAEPVKCSHEWVTIKSYEIVSNAREEPKGCSYMMKCVNCGEHKNERIYG